MFGLLILIALLVVLASSVFISYRVFRSLEKDGKAGAWVLSILVFCISACVLGLGLAYLIADNVRLER